MESIRCVVQYNTTAGQTESIIVPIINNTIINNTIVTTHNIQCQYPSFSGTPNLINARSHLNSLKSNSTLMNQVREMLNNIKRNT